MEDRDDADQHLRKISDKELSEKIVRVKGMCKDASKLPDSGQKLQVHLRNLESEWERRKHLKALIYNLRKAGQIEVDWSKLLPSDRKDDEPPLVLVIEDMAEESKQQEEVTMEDKEDVDKYLKKISDKELMETIARLRSNLRTLEAEREQRKLLKAVTYNLRKAGRIELDWIKLLPSDRKDHEPPPVLVSEGTDEEL